MGIGSSLLPDTVRESYLRKFTLVVVVLVIVGAVLGVVMTGQVTGLLTEQSEDEMGATADLSADAAETWVQSNEQSTRMLANYEVLRGNNTVNIEERLEREAENHESVVDIHRVTLPSNVAQSPEIRQSTDDDLVETTLDDLDVRWATESGEPILPSSRSVVVSEVYEREGTPRIAFMSSISRGLGDSTGVMVVANASDIGFESATAGAFTQVVDQNGTVQLAGDPGAVGDAYALSGEGTEPLNASAGVQQRGEFLVASAPVEGTNWVVLSHAPLSSVYQLRSTVQLMMGGLIVLFLLGFVFIGATIGRNTVTSLTTLTGKADQLRDGDLDVEIEDSTDRVDELGTLYESFAEMRDALERRVKEAEVARAEAVEMNDYLQSKADEYAETLERAASGDLTSRLERDGENEAMDRIAADFNEMISELEKTTGQLKSFADEVETAGRDVQQSADTVREASEEVADSIQRVSDDAYDQRERLQTISETMDDIAGDIEAFAAEHPELDFEESLDRIEEIATMLNDVADLSEETMGEAENVAGAAEEQAAELNEVSERANDLTRYASPLQEVLDRFETESEHEFYFPTGPGGSANVHED